MFCITEQAAIVAATRCNTLLSVFRNAASSYPQHSSGALARKLFVVRRHHQRAAFAGQAVEQIPELRAAIRIERCGGLVQKQKQRVDGKGPGDGDALGFAARKLARQGCRTVLDAERGEQFARAALSLALGNPARVLRREADFLSTERCSKR